MIKVCLSVNIKTYSRLEGLISKIVHFFKIASFPYLTILAFFVHLLFEYIASLITMNKKFPAISHLDRL